MDKSTPQWLDPTTLQMLVDLGKRRDRDLLGQLYGLFQTQGPQGIAAMRRAIEAADAVALSEAAHSLKGSYRSLGTPRLAELASRLEDAGRDRRLDGASALVDALEAAFHQTDAALGEFIAAGRGA